MAISIFPVATVSSALTGASGGGAIDLASLSERHRPTNGMVGADTNEHMGRIRFVGKPREHCRSI